MKRKHTRNQRLGWIPFLIYLAALSYFLFFAELMGRTQEQMDYHYNLVLFKEINRFITYREKLGMEAVLLNLVGNVAAFMPFGFFFPVISRRTRHWYTMVLLGAAFSLGIETIQLITKVGSFDVDDILLNTIGSLLGYWSFLMVQKVRSMRRGR